MCRCVVACCEMQPDVVQHAGIFAILHFSYYVLILIFFWHTKQYGSIGHWNGGVCLWLMMCWRRCVAVLDPHALLPTLSAIWPCSSEDEIDMRQLKATLKGQFGILVFGPHFLMSRCVIYHWRSFSTRFIQFFQLQRSLLLGQHKSMGTANLSISFTYSTVHLSQIDYNDRLWM